MPDYGYHYGPCRSGGSGWVIALIVVIVLAGVGGAGAGIGTALHWIGIGLKCLVGVIVASLVTYGLYVVRRNRRQDKMQAEAIAASQQRQVIPAAQYGTGALAAGERQHALRARQQDQYPTADDIAEALLRKGGYPAEPATRVTEYGHRDELPGGR